MGAHLSLLGLEPVGGEPLMSVTRSQCDARPAVTIQAVIWYQIILLGVRNTYAICSYTLFEITN